MIYIADGLTVKFSLCNWLMLDCVKNGEKVPTIIEIKVLARDENKNLQPVSWYRREFDKKVNNKYLDNFCNKFMKDKEYRKQFFVSGEKVDWDQFSLIKYQRII